MRGWGLILVALLAGGAVAAARADKTPGAPSGKAPDAAGLGSALTHWTGMTPSLSWQGKMVRIALPPQSPVAALTAQAEPARHGDEPGWALRSLRVPSPALLRDGSRLAISQQSGRAWLGARTADLDLREQGVRLTALGHAPIGLDHGVARASSAGDQVAVTAALDGVHASGVLALLNSARLAAQTSAAGGAALAAWVASGRQAGAVPVTLQSLDAQLGPASLHASGQVVLTGPDQRDGTLEVRAKGFDALMNSLPEDKEALKLLPALLVLRQLATKDGDGLAWTIRFEGRHVLVQGLDLAALGAF